MTLSGKKVLVIGGGQSGLSAARFLLRKKAHVTLSDSRPKRVFLNSHQKVPSLLTIVTGSQRRLSGSFDLVVVSPGVPWDHPLLRAARKKKIEILPEFELGLKFVSPKKIVGVTGTNGKTTTTALIGHLLKTAKVPHIVAGNIGTPLTSLIHRVKKNTTLVLELSSYQLEAHKSLKVDVGIWLNLTPDHLTRHKTMPAYARIKARLFANKKGGTVAVLNKRDAWCRRMSAGIRVRKIWFPSPALEKIASHIQLPGIHNLENSMAASAALLHLKISKGKIIRGLKSFRGVPHRLQRVASRKGVSYFNDSKSTNVDSTRVALKSLNGPLFLILGGRHKGTSYRSLVPLLREKVGCVFTVGEAQKIIKKDLDGVVPVFPCGRLDKAVKKAAKVAPRGSAVLLSPACASFDQYKNFEKRGEDFSRLVQSLRK